MNGEVFLSFISVDLNEKSKVVIYKGLVTSFERLRLLQEITAIDCPQHSSLIRSGQLKLVVVS